jgi:hypothetical protein
MMAKVRIWTSLYENIGSFSHEESELTNKRILFSSLGFCMTSEIPFLSAVTTNGKVITWQVKSCGKTRSWADMFDSIWRKYQLRWSNDCNRWFVTQMSWNSKNCGEESIYLLLRSKSGRLIRTFIVKWPFGLDCPEHLRIQNFNKQNYTPPTPGIFLKHGGALAVKSFEDHNTHHLYNSSNGNHFGTFTTEKFVLYSRVKTCYAGHV